MPESARERILGRLRAAREASIPIPPSDFGVMERKRWSAPERYPRLRKMMEAVKTEFVETTPETWPQAIYEFLASQKLSRLLYGPGTPEGARLASSWPTGSGPALLPYDRPVEELKRALFEEVDAGFTTTRGGIAETGGLLLWPGPEEPRLLSLVPPVHLALLDTDRIHDTFWQALGAEGWAKNMPANALIISGPSKTADIEQTLAYGVHGPKRLVVFAVKRSS